MKQTPVGIICITVSISSDVCSQVKRDEASLLQWVFDMLSHRLHVVSPTTRLDVRPRHISQTLADMQCTHTYRSMKIDQHHEPVIGSLMRLCGLS